MKKHLTQSTSFSDDLVALNSLFNVNVGLGGEVGNMISKFPKIRQEALQPEFELHLSQGTLNSKDFLRFTACSARDDATARAFFEHLYRYAFKDGEEPDVTDYWDR